MFYLKEIFGIVSILYLRKSVRKRIYMKNRKSKILEILTSHQRIEVAALSEELGVSQVTIRKDLDTLEETGIIKREHGFAILSSTNNILGRLAYHYETKKQIALRASELIHDGETLMIESGSCCAILAETLAETKKNLTLITNSAFIADHIRRKTNFEIVLLGGIYQHDSQALVGPMIRQCAENFWVEHFFIGVDGYSLRTGFTNADQMRAQAVRDMAYQAEQVVVLTESEKFEKHGTVPLNITRSTIYVITDDRIPVQTETQLAEQSIRVIKSLSETK